MKYHTTMDDAARERAADYAFGVLDEGEVLPYEAHLYRCAQCRAEVESLRRGMDAIATAMPATQPPPDLFERVLARIDSPAEASGARPWRTWPASARGGFEVTTATDTQWEPTLVPGIEARKLFCDPQSDRVTMLVRMAAGTAYPRHRHGGPEECFVLEGQVNVGSRVLRAGDYQFAAAGSVHELQSTTDGCLLFIMSSLTDELIQSA
jgi:putative transcriptional regulator